MNAIESFQGEFRFLSNFWPCSVQLDGIDFKSVECAYVAAKAVTIEMKWYISILEPAAAKAHGRKMKIRPDWDEVKLSIMEDLVRQKFMKNEQLKENLKSTSGRELIEGNTWRDTFWGVCNGVGQNNLGKILMKVRSEL